MGVAPCGAAYKAVAMTQAGSATCVVAPLGSPLGLETIFGLRGQVLHPCHLKQGKYSPHVSQGSGYAAGYAQSTLQSMHRNAGRRVVLRYDIELIFRRIFTRRSNLEKFCSMLQNHALANISVA